MVNITTLGEKPEGLVCETTPKSIPAAKCTTIRWTVVGVLASAAPMVNVDIFKNSPSQWIRLLGFAVAMLSGIMVIVGRVFADRIPPIDGLFKTKKCGSSEPQP